MDAATNHIGTTSRGRRARWVAVSIVALVGILALVGTLTPRDEIRDTGPTSVAVPMDATAGEQKLGIAEESSGESIDGAARPSTITSDSTGVPGVGDADEMAVPDLAANQALIKTGALTIELPRRSNVADAVQEVSDIARRSKGFVSASTLSGDGSSARSTVTIRVAAAQFDEAMESLGALGTVTSRTSDVVDVTEQLTDARSRLRSARAVEERLLLLLAKATDVGDALAVQQRIDATLERIELERGQIAMLERQASMSTISIDLAVVNAPRSTTEREWGIRSSFSEAAHAFVDSIANGLIAVAGALPALLLIAVGAMVGRVYWRRRNGAGATTK